MGIQKIERRLSRECSWSYSASSFLFSINSLFKYVVAPFRGILFSFSNFRGTVISDDNTSDVL